MCTTVTDSKLKNKQEQSGHLITYRPDIDGLRAFAVLSVVLYHAFPSIMRGGFVGVDVFFVISGFLISSIIFRELNQGNFSFINFYSRRIRRIYPALFLVLLATLGFGWFALFPEELRQLGKHTAGGAAFISNLLYWAESGYFDSESAAKPLLHLWSLGIEEQFYIVFPILAYLGWKKRLNMFLLVVVIFSLSFICNIALHRSLPDTTFYSPMTRFWELLSGVMLAVVPYRYPQATAVMRQKAQAGLSRILPQKLQTNLDQTLSNILSVLGFALLLISVFFTLRAHFPGFRPLLPLAGTMFLITAGPLAIVNRTLFSYKSVVFIGLISYPLYLWHWPILSYLHIIKGDTSNHFEKILCIALAILLSSITYLLFEKPIRFGFAKECQKRVAAILLGAVTIVGALGLALFCSDGFPGRGKAMLLHEAQWSHIKTHDQRDKAGMAYAGIKEKRLSFFCRFTDAQSSTTVAVIGDSHAQSAYPGIAKFNMQQGVNTFLLGGPAWRPLLDDSRPQMQKHVDISRQILDIIKSKSDITKVFIIARGAVYWTGASMDGNNHGDTTNINVYRDSLQLIVRELRHAGKTVHVVSEIPELRTSIKYYLPRPFRKSIPAQPTLKAEHLLNRSDHLALLASIEGAVSIDTTEAFCPTDECKVFDDTGLPLYIDTDHLSVPGSDFLLEKSLKPYLTVP